MTRPSSRRTLAAATLSVALLAAACSGDDDEGADDTSPATVVTAATDAPTTDAPTTVAATTTEAPTTTTEVAPEDSTFSIATMLAEIPASIRNPEDGTLLITVGDLDGATELAGATRPSPDAPGDLDPLIEWLNPISGFAFDPDEVPTIAVQLPQVVRYENLRSNAEIAAEFGWSVLDVRSYVELLDPPATFTVMRADVTADELSAAIEDERDGIWFLGGEDGSQNLREATPGRPLGESLRFALDEDGLLAASRTTPPLDEWLAGDTETLADDEAISAVATALDAAGVYSATIVDVPAFEPRPDDPPETGELLLEPFELLGAGVTLDDGVPRGVFVYHYGTAQDANANEDAVRTVFTEGRSVFSGQPLDELLLLEDVVVAGANVVATVAFVERSPLMVWQMVSAQDLPVTHR